MDGLELKARAESPDVEHESLGVGTAILGTTVGYGVEANLNSNHPPTSIGNDVRRTSVCPNPYYPH